jgi:hypothetical protein
MKGKEKRAALVAVLLMLVPVWAMAEGERGTRDITFAVIVLGTALMAGMAYLWRRQILKTVLTCVWPVSLSIHPVRLSVLV